MKPTPKNTTIILIAIIAAITIAILVPRTIHTSETPNNTILLIPWLKPLEETKGTIRVKIASINPERTVIAKTESIVALEIAATIELEGRGAVEAKTCLKGLAAGRSPETPIILEAKTLQNNCSKTVVVRSGEPKTITVKLQLKLPKTPAVGRKTILALPLELEASPGNYIKASLDPSGAITIGGSGEAKIKLLLQAINIKIKSIGNQTITITPSKLERETTTITASSSKPSTT